MRSVLKRLLFVGFIVLAGSEFAQGGNYSDQSGFSFTYPDGWFAIDRDSMSKVNQHLPPVIKNWIAKNNFDFNQVAVLLLRDGNDEFLENLNVVVEKQQIPATDRSVRELESSVTKGYREMGMTFDNFQGRVEKIGSRDVIVIELQVRMPGIADLLHQKQVMIPAGGKTYIVTCTAKTNTYDRYRPTFDSILASIQAPAPVATGFDFSRIFKNGLVWGIVGGMVGGLIAVMRKVSGRK